MFTIMVVFHTLVAILLVVVVLMQSAKGEGLAGAFGGGGGSGLSGAVFGGRGAASFLSKATTILAVVFMVNCGVLAYLSSHRSGASTGTVESAVSEKAMEEYERAQEQQQMMPPQEGEAGSELPPADGVPAGDDASGGTETQPTSAPTEGSGN